MSEKKIDESWKEKAKGEEPDLKQQAEAEKTPQEEMPPVNFALFISSLGMQAMMALGEIENSVSNKKEKSLPQAKYLIDILEMLQEKTKGNLKEEEAQMIEQMLYELRMKYITANTNA